MTPLAITSLILGLALTIAGLFAIIKPANSISFLSGLPRNVWLGRLFTAVALIWAAILTYREHFEIVDKNIWLLYLVTPIVIWLTIKYVDELLCARAIGGILCILPAPMLDAAFIENSPTRLFVTFFAYLMAICGMVLIWSPYLMRKALAPCIKNKSSILKCGTITLLAGLFYCIAAFFIYE